MTLHDRNLKATKSPSRRQKADADRDVTPSKKIRSRAPSKVLVFVSDTYRRRRWQTMRRRRYRWLRSQTSSPLSTRRPSSDTFGRVRCLPGQTSDGPRGRRTREENRWSSPGRKRFRAKTSKGKKEDGEEEDERPSKSDFHVCSLEEIRDYLEVCLFNSKFPALQEASIDC